MRDASSNICQNCNAKNETSFQYCATCGQKNTNGKITFSELWSEFQDAVFNIESRTWRTFKHLFIPGRLTLEYFSGKHRRYVHPLRLLLVTSLLFIIAMNFQDFQSSTNHGYNVKDRIQKNHERFRLLGIIENITDTTNAIFPEPQTEIITDTILVILKDSLNSLLFETDNEFANRYGDKYGLNFDINKYASFGDENRELIAKHDFLYKSEDELVDIYKKDAGAFERFVFKQKVKHIKDESQLMAAILSHSTWAALLMMPCLALVLFLLNFRHHYFYIEHLIFTFHIHSFVFLVIAFMILGLNIFPWWIIAILIGVIGIYVFVSMWKVYKQNLIKTLFKFLVLTLSYLGVFILFLIGTIIFTFLLL